jgi:3-hydroxy-9,10-secoandrosta-1,3,5(10)-triene-9,17-dione monooxygenase reductase component
MISTALAEDEFRKVMSHFATGIAIVTGRDGNQIHGMTCNAFCSISVSPMLVLVSLTEYTRTEKIIEAGRIFAVNFLSEKQCHLSDRFAGRHRSYETNRFEGVQWSTAVTGAPILKGSMAYVDCEVSNIFRQGSHVLFVGDVVAAHYDDCMLPLICFQSQYMTVDRSARLDQS